MKTIVEALKALHTKLGGTDHQDVGTISEMIDKVTEVAGSGSGGGSGDGGFPVVNVSAKRSSEGTYSDVTVDTSVNDIQAYLSNKTPVVGFLTILGEAGNQQGQSTGFFTYYQSVLYCDWFYSGQKAELTYLNGYSGITEK